MPEPDVPGVFQIGRTTMVQAQWFTYGPIPPERAREMQRRMVSAAARYYREWKIEEADEEEANDGDSSG